MVAVRHHLNRPPMVTTRYDHLRSPSPIAGIFAVPVLARPNAVGVLGHLTIKSQHISRLLLT
jgi:hypothetical protein